MRHTLSYQQDMALPDVDPALLHFLQPTACNALTHILVSLYMYSILDIILCRKDIVPLEHYVTKGRFWARFSNLKANYTALFLIFSSSPRHMLKQRLKGHDRFLSYLSGFINHNNRPITHHMQFRKLVVSSLECRTKS
jgi:hypothetical protein